MEKEKSHKKLMPPVVFLLFVLKKLAYTYEIMPRLLLLIKKGHRVQWKTNLL